MPINPILKPLFIRNIQLSNGIHGQHDPVLIDVPNHQSGSNGINGSPSVINSTSPAGSTSGSNNPISGSFIPSLPTVWTGSSGIHGNSSTISNNDPSTDVSHHINRPTSNNLDSDWQPNNTDFTQVPGMPLPVINRPDIGVSHHVNRPVSSNPENDHTNPNIDTSHNTNHGFDID